MATISELIADRNAADQGAADHLQRLLLELLDEEFDRRLAAWRDCVKIRNSYESEIRLALAAKRRRRARRAA